MKYVVTSGSVVTEFIDQASAESFATLNGVDITTITTLTDPPPALTNDDIFAQKIAQGYNIPGTPYYLAMGDNDRSQFSAMLNLINQAIALGMITPDTPQSVMDKDRNPVKLTTLQFQQVMVGYGFYYKQLWDQVNN